MVFDQRGILSWLCKASLEEQSPEQMGHWNSIAVMSAEHALSHHSQDMSTLQRLSLKLKAM